VKKKWLVLGCVLAATLPFALFAQDAHYNSQQPDSKGTLNGGTGTAGSRELSAAYYNPGIIALFEKSNLGISGNLYAFDFINLSNGTGQGGELKGSNMQVIPSLFAGTFKWKKNEKLTTTYAYINRNFYANRLKGFGQAQINLNGQIVNSVNNYDVRTRFSEDWIGAGVSYRINEYWGIGIIPFVHVYSMQYLQQNNYQLSPQNVPTDLIKAVTDYREARLFTPGVLFNLGLVYSKGDHEFGFNIISPRINISILAFSSIERSITNFNAGDSATSSFLYDDDFLAIINRPLEINLGYAWLRDNRSIKVRLSYYSPLKRYSMGRSSTDEIRTGVFNRNYANQWLPVSSVQQVINFGIGYEWRVNSKLNVITGFRTDFTFFDKSQFKYADFTTVLVFWDIYHLSGGIDWTYKWLKLNTGVDYGFSFQDGLSHFVDFNQAGKPLDEVELSNDARVQYHQFKVFLGLVVSFN
jgi:hypothetical protein